MIKVEGYVPKEFIDEYGDLLRFVDFAYKSVTQGKFLKKGKEVI